MSTRLTLRRGAGDLLRGGVPPATNRRGHGAANDPAIQPESLGCRIRQIHLQTGGGIGVLAGIELCQPRQSRQDPQSGLSLRHRRKKLRLFRHEGSRTHKTHLTAEDMDELRKFIQGRRT